MGKTFSVKSPMRWLAKRRKLPVDEPTGKREKQRTGKGAREWLYNLLPDVFVQTGENRSTLHYRCHGSYTLLCVIASTELVDCCFEMWRSYQKNIFHSRCRCTVIDMGSVSRTNKHPRDCVFVHAKMVRMGLCGVADQVCLFMYMWGASSWPWIPPLDSTPYYCRLSGVDATIFWPFFPHSNKFVERYPSLTLVSIESTHVHLWKTHWTCKFHSMDVVFVVQNSLLDEMECNTDGEVMCMLGRTQDIVCR